MHFKQVRLFRPAALIAVVALAASLPPALLKPARADTVLSTEAAFAANPGSIGVFGEPDIATWGQTFTTPFTDTFLNDFTFHVEHNGQPAPTPFDAFVYAWDGTKATGPQLFASGPQPFVATGSGSVPFTVNTAANGGVALTGGNQYVACFSASNRFDGVDDISAFDFTDNNAYTGGDLVYFHNGNNFNALTTTAWDGANTGLGDLRFSASFSATAIPAPEPSTWAMMLIGLATLAFATRRKRLV